MKVSIFTGDIAGAEGDAICTSTNPRLSLVMGTGVAVRRGGGFAILRECEAIVAEAGGSLPAGSVHVTSAGTLPHRIAIHCVASGEDHRSSPEIVGRCTEGALAAAASAGSRRVVLPVFAAGHARVPFAEAVAAMAGVLRTASHPLESVVIAIPDPDRAGQARRILEKTLGAGVEVVEGESDQERESFWSMPRD